MDQKPILKKINESRESNYLGYNRAGIEYGKEGIEKDSVEERIYDIVQELNKFGNGKISKLEDGTVVVAFGNKEKENEETYEFKRSKLNNQITIRAERFRGSCFIDCAEVSVYNTDLKAIFKIFDANNRESVSADAFLEYIKSK